MMATVFITPEKANFLPRSRELRYHCPMRRTQLFFLSLLTLATAAVQAQAPTHAQKLDLVPHANYESPPPAGKDLNKQITTRERDVTINGVTFRQIQYKGQYYTVNLQQADPQVDCTRMNMPQDTFAAGASFKITKRTALFIETLRQTCDEHLHTVLTSPDMRDGNIGVKFKGKDSEKAILVNPLKQMGSVRTDF
jgi:hypothetical protein